MATPVLMIDSLQKNPWMQASRMPLGLRLPGIFPHPVVLRSAVTTPTISVVVFWRQQ
mgnify:CR=1 FL=1